MSARAGRGGRLLAPCRCGCGKKGHSVAPFVRIPAASRKSPAASPGTRSTSPRYRRRISTRRCRSRSRSRRLGYTAALRRRGRCRARHRVASIRWCRRRSEPTTACRRYRLKRRDCRRGVTVVDPYRGGPRSGRSRCCPRLPRCRRGPTPRHRPCSNGFKCIGFSHGTAGRRRANALIPHLPDPRQIWRSPRTNSAVARMQPAGGLVGSCWNGPLPGNRCRRCIQPAARRP